MQLHVRLQIKLDHQYLKQTKIQRKTNQYRHQNLIIKEPKQLIKLMNFKITFNNLKKIDNEHLVIMMLISIRVREYQEKIIAL